MCWCTPSIRTPNCGSPECHPPNKTVKPGKRSEWQLRVIDERDELVQRIARLDQMRLVTEILSLLKGHGFTTVHVRHINAVIDAANRICDEFGRPDRIAAPGSGLIAWACSDEVGMSSVFMARRLSAHAGLRFPGHRIKDEPAHPYDPDDFGRCLGLLEAVPELREHVPKMAEHGKVWTAYVAHWAEMEALYQEEFPLGRAPKLAALMKLLQESA